MTLWVSSIGAAVVASVLQIDNCLTIGQTDGWKDDAKLILEGPSMNYDSTELLLALPKSQGGCHQVVGNYNDTLWHAEHHVLRLWIFLSCTTLLDYHWISCWPPYLFVRLVWVVGCVAGSSQFIDWRFISSVNKRNGWDGLYVVVIWTRES